MVKCRDEVTSSRPKENPLEHLLQGVYLYSLFSMGCITPLVVPDTHDQPKAMRGIIWHNQEIQGMPPAWRDPAPGELPEAKLRHHRFPQSRC